MPFFQTAPEKTGKPGPKGHLPCSHGPAAVCNERRRILSRDRIGQFFISEGVPVWQHFQANGPGKFPKSLLATTVGRQLNLDSHYVDGRGRCR
jgi:hypothetical protein